uniref:WGR domain-containing protein n=1 Tax=Chromera velia CCMP2878 TaxID=1169474 RepID=A0A0G4IC20_9ALVE|eukprot:Cvel_13017.t1-p1 / transcript=Cvel_13017.t1 / gene=Cvel_13017 / organism=Chromera_velia_CCMP2878 / gene_product=hypothetical protein / transcript_product=hypothetical protein / location=Cvel_scaffold873:55896-58583(+) / protein_length=342 / sequence_SO=supercontig / SO=protein_coding / is_pseudo=false
MAACRFECKAGGSSKFWEISTDEKTTTIRFGKIGTDGVTQIKAHGSAAEAEKYEATQKASKLKKGYKEVVTSGTAKRKAPAPDEPPKKSKADSEKVTGGDAPSTSSLKKHLTMDEKFWEIVLAGSKTTVRFGKIGTSGSTSVKEHKDAPSAKKFYDKMVAEKTGKGYEEEDEDGDGDDDEDDEGNREFDPNDFWDTEYPALGPQPLTDAIVSEVESRLGFKLPRDYVEFFKQTQNGGTPKRTCYEEEVGSISNMYGIGTGDGETLVGMSDNWLNEWEYPNDCVYFAETPSAGHDMVAFDYSECGPQGSPSVVNIDQEGDYERNKIADSFSEFIRMLKPEEDD